jgi:hypothetical protein
MAKGKGEKYAGDKALQIDGRVDLMVITGRTLSSQQRSPTPRADPTHRAAPSKTRQHRSREAAGSGEAAAQQAAEKGDEPTSKRQREKRGRSWHNPKRSTR